MTLKYTRHKDEAAIEGEFQNIDEQKQEKIVFLSGSGSRDPVSGDAFDIAIRAKTDGTMVFWAKHPVTGVWKSVNLS